MLPAECLLSVYHSLPSSKQCSQMDWLIAVLRAKPSTLLSSCKLPSPLNSLLLDGTVRTPDAHWSPALSGAPALCAPAAGGREARARVLHRAAVLAALALHALDADAQMAAQLASPRAALAWPAAALLDALLLLTGAHASKQCRCRVRREWLPACLSHRDRGDCGGLSSLFICTLRQSSGRRVSHRRIGADWLFECPLCIRTHWLFECSCQNSGARAVGMPPIKEVCNLVARAAAQQGVGAKSGTLRRPRALAACAWRCRRRGCGGGSAGPPRCLPRALPHPSGHPGSCPSRAAFAEANPAGGCGWGGRP